MSLSPLPLRAAALLSIAVLPWTLTACSGGSGEGSDGEGVKPWNVLLITLDTTRPDRLGAYGHEAARTPVLDDLANRGLRYERALSTAGITPMSHSSILTGLNNYRHGMRVFHSEEVSHRLKDEVDSLPEILGRRGWRTGAAISAYPVSEHYNLHQGFETFATGSVQVEDLSLETQQKHKNFWNRGGSTSTQRSGEQTIDDALAFIADGPADRPWCLWVHLFDAHDFSVVPPQEFLDLLGVTCPEPGTLTQGRAQHEWRERMYDPELAYIDAQLGRLVKDLEERGERDETIIVVTADHGQGLLDGLKRHGWGKHRLLYDWCLRVPMIVCIPDQAPGVVQQQVRTIDVLPTVLEALGLPEAQDIEGQSMLPLARGEAEPAPRMAYADALNIYDTHSPKPSALKQHYDNLFCATDGVWKLIWHERQPENSELYHLAEDPLELTNLWRADHPEFQRLYAFLEEREAWKTEPPTAGSGGNAAALEALGYGGDSDDDAEEEEDE